ncbi:cancer/testis antigen 55-like [Phodopus roborovskii]|uniref:cancer/testis antigen 55-like n=1 Tax=Phodopus roborovskii TaxID=109678 RepID=UPI0021E363C4|nr:cancer/testis antigen 55-like [Phodopus roborovskii]
MGNGTAEGSGPSHPHLTKGANSRDLQSPSSDVGTPLTLIGWAGERGGLSQEREQRRAAANSEPGALSLALLRAAEVTTSMQKLQRRISEIFQRKTKETPLEQRQACVIDNSKLKSVQGIVTHLCTDYGWINESIFFNTDVVCGNIPVNIGTNVIALVEETKTTHTLKAAKVKAMTNLLGDTEESVLDRELCIRCVTSVTQDNIYISRETFFPVKLFSGEFKPLKGDLLLIEYSLKPGSSDMKIHSVSPLSSQNIKEVCVTSLDGRTGVVETSIFFTLDSLQKPKGYIPELYDIVNVVAVDSIQPHCSRRAVSMFPAEMCIGQAL